MAKPADDLKLVGVRDCDSTDGPAAHLMYTYHGKPLSLYVLQKDKGHSGTASKMGRDAVIWCAKGRTYAVVADGHPQDLTRIVDYMKANAE
jgi:anti-sigma factor RsiW